MPRFEYLVMLLHHSTELVRGPAGTPAERTWQSELTVWRPDATTPDTFPASGDSGISWFNKLNEFGQDRWELVSEHTLGVAISSEMQGWTDVSWPVSLRWTFKREVSVNA